MRTMADVEPNCSCGRHVSCDEPELYPVCPRCMHAHRYVELQERRRMLRALMDVPLWLSENLTRGETR